MADVTLDEFTAEVTAFLDANAEKKPPARELAWGEGDDSTAMFEEVDREQEKALVRESQAWRARRYDAGLGWITGPAEYGGRELSAAHDRVYAQLESQYAVPSSFPFTIGLGMVAPTIAAHGTDEVKERFLAIGAKRGWGETWEQVAPHAAREFMNAPAGFVGEPEDVGQLVAFLASERARYIHGANIRIDGGAADCVN